MALWAQVTFIVDYVWHTLRVLEYRIDNFIMSNEIGLGNEFGVLKVYIQNRPPLDEYRQLTSMRALQSGDIAEIAHLTGNHWRKIFNVYAKLCFELEPLTFSCWQEYRDELLLQNHGPQSLLFSAPWFPSLELKKQCAAESHINIIMGKTYASELLKLTTNSAITLHWVDEYFAINKKHRLIVCPYFDYRQLSNIKISQLVALIKSIYS